MKKRSITLIIWFMSIALLGVMAMQYYFIRQSYIQKSQIFDESVNASLSVVANKIERHEVYEFTRKQAKLNQVKFAKDQKLQREKEVILAEQIALQDEINKLRVKNFDARDRYRNEEEDLKRNFPNAAYVSNAFFETYVRRKDYHQLITFSIEKSYDIQDPTLPTISTVVGASKRVSEISARDDSTRFIIPIVNDATLQVHSFAWATLPPTEDKSTLIRLQEVEQELKNLNFRKLSVATNLYDTVAILGGKDSKVIEDITASIAMSKRPLKERINADLAMSYLEEELHIRGIVSPFLMQIRPNPSAALIIQAGSHLEDPVRLTDAMEYSTALFQGDQGKSPGLLSIYFPYKESHIAGNMSFMVIAVLALLSLLVGCFAYTLTIIFRQKKISEMKTDFINNMTHEFKTPVATIMIASESLRDKEIASNENRVNKLANIIYDENIRLGSHIERVLNIARLEKENLNIERTKVPINALMSDVLESMHLQLEKAGGNLQVDLSATHDVVIGDELHLSNVMFNLLDNAIKYSKDTPDITVRTYSTKNSITLSVADKGVGMSKDHQEKIFDQFYRIPTGNIHNVKGFGLGLSYVNNIIKILNGKISVKSERDKGTQFEVTLPLHSTDSTSRA
ncbi:HAMP domain-containing histidine kinase [Sphingobacterium sp. lm-10]|uniref:sensor histidine kinase n=1 Tax=Sphingobacterium sp. lm-10 TaxID=2944904 RepID=UPI0020229538|nr:HAMP domain-containing sensor histidine kinase [Sphingobacterium sp. lm-10]MCL7988781.1 HAMP domain-containing histidine kinase [Sphingobacterium sp. lm-10]